MPKKPRRPPGSRSEDSHVDAEPRPFFFSETDLIRDETPVDYTPRSLEGCFRLLNEWVPDVFAKIADGLRQHGIGLKGSFLNNSDLADLDLLLSTCDARTRKIATLMFRLGMLVIKHDWLKSERDRLWPNAVNSGVGSKKKSALAEPNHNAIRDAFAVLLADGTALTMKKSEVYKQISRTFGGARGFSEGSVLRAIQDLKAEVLAMLRAPDVSALPRDEQVDEVIRRHGNEPGVSKNTVAFLLPGTVFKRPKSGKRP